MPKTEAHTYEFVRDYFQQQGCELLETEYKNSRTKMRYRCSCGRESNIVFYSFKLGCRCKECGNKKNSDKQKTITTEFLRSYFEERGCVLIDEYTDNATVMRYICSCGSESTCTWMNFRTGRRCKNCGLKRRSGEQHYDWREDRDRLRMERRYRQLMYRVMKVIPETRFKVTLENVRHHVGYSIDEFIQHFRSFAGWDELSRADWEIDHIYPVSAFYLSGIRDLKLINSLDNLRPVPAGHNRTKSSCYNPVAFVRWLESKGVPLP